MKPIIHFASLTLIVCFLSTPTGFSQSITQGSKEGPMLVVNSDDAQIKVSNNGVEKVIESVPNGTRLWSLETRGQFFMVVAPAKRTKGWISKKFVVTEQFTPTQFQKLSKSQSATGQANNAAQSGNLKEAIRLHKQALKIIDATIGPNHLYSESSLSSLADLHMRRSEHEIAKTYLQRMLKVQEQMLGTGHVKCAQTLMRLGQLHKIAKDYKPAISLYKRAIAIIEKKLKPVNIPMAMCLADIGTIFLEQTEYSKAAAYFERTVEIEAKLYGKGNPNTYGAIAGLASCYMSLRNYAKAGPLLKEAVKLTEKKLGPDHLETAKSYANLAGYHSEINELPIALKLSKQALAVFESSLGNKHPDTLRLQANVASILRRQGNDKGASSISDRIITLEAKDSGLSNIVSTAKAKYEKGMVLRKQGKLDSAESQFKQALGVFEKQLGKSHPSSIRLNYDLAISKIFQNQTTEAVDELDQVYRNTHLYFGQILPYLSEAEQISFLKSDFDFQYSLGLTVATVMSQDNGIANKSADWLLNSKAVSIQAITKRNLLFKNVKNSSTSNLAKELVELRSKLAELAMSGKGSQPNSKLAKIVADQSKTEKGLVNRIVEEHGDIFPKHSWKNIDDVKKTLRPNTVFVDLERFVFTNLVDMDTSHESYSAWIIRNGAGPAEIVELGKAVEIDHWVKRVRDKLRKAANGQIKDEGEFAATHQLQSDLQQLAAIVWHPIEARLEDNVEHIVLSPDSMLWLVPWSALPSRNDNSENLIEKYSVRMVTSGRDLLFTPSEHQTKRPVVVANPTFDQQAAQKRESIKRIFNRVPERTLSPTRSYAANSLLPKALPLPNTAAEADAIIPKIKSYTDREPILYTERFALEHVAKQLNSPEIVTFATHGFFLPNPSTGDRDSNVIRPINRQAVANENKKNPLENPLLRCGLLLAGCNLRTSIVGDDDGILTGMEITGIDFRGTELVVLSACDTGIGDVRNGEGVAGLRQAFQLAGAESVLASLWQVDDGETARLMNLFFDNLAKGMTKSESLRQAQLTRIKARRARHGAAHPFFWAAFTLTGQD